MRKSSTLWLIPAIVIALLATWLHSRWINQQKFTANVDKSRIDYYLSDFSLLMTDEQGKLRYQMNAEHFVHNVSSKQSTIYKPLIVAKQQTDSITLQAEKAIHNASGDITLSGKVLIKKPESQQSDGFLLKTEDITYSPAKQLIDSDAAFSLETSHGHSLTGTGLTDDLKNHTLRIKSNVHEEYKPNEDKPSDED